MTETREATLRAAIRSRIPASKSAPDHREKIAEVAGVIAARFQPERIVLFGSHATQRADADSDADLMVVMDCAGPPLDQAIAIYRAVPRRIPLDVLVRTTEQIATGLAENDFFITDVMTEGITLFEAGDAGLD
jgi:predicted nucleotidyltransferase